MFPGLLVSLVLAALPLVQSGEQSVTLESERPLAGNQSASLLPAIFWLSAAPPFEVIRLPENAGEKPLYGRIPAEDSPGLPFLLGKGGGESSGYRVLFPDLNRNGDFTDDGPPILGTIVRKNDRITIYFPALSHGSSSDSENAFPVSPPDGAVRFSFTPARAKPLFGFYYPRQGKTGMTALEAARSSKRRVQVQKPTPPPPIPRPKAEIKINWLETLSEAKERAKKEGKPILLLLTVQDSSLCRTYLEHTFHDADVVELLGAVVPVHVSCGEEDETALQFGVSGFPFVLILDDALEIKNRIAGYRSAQDFVQILEVLLP